MNLVMAEAVEMFGTFLWFLLMARVIMSWMVRGQDGALGKIYNIVLIFSEPLVAPIRKLIQRSPLGGGGMMVDFSPLLAFIAIRVITNLLADFLRNL
ncbi:MAG: YggT family protein [Defluviitaleaceae bacterium]|nr:YggT family protein [Defluviitaleaceae bacterium]